MKTKLWKRGLALLLALLMSVAGTFQAAAEGEETAEAVETEETAKAAEPADAAAEAAETEETVETEETTKPAEPADAAAEAEEPAEAAAQEAGEVPAVAEQSMIRITIEGWGAGFELSGYRIFEGQAGTITASPQPGEGIVPVDEHTLAFDPAMLGSEMDLKIYTGWTYAASLQLTLEDGSIREEDVSSLAYGESYRLDLTGVTAVYLLVGTREEAASVTVLGMPLTPQEPSGGRISLKAAAPTSGSTTITLMPESGHSGRSYDNTTGNHLFCVDMSMATPSDGQSFVYQDLASCLASYGQGDKAQAVYFVLYNYWTNRYPSSGTPTYEMSACSEDGWPYQNLVTGVIWKLMGFQPAGYDDVYMEAIEDMAAAALSYAASYPNGRDPENSIISSVGALYPEDAGSSQPLISVGAPVQDTFLRLRKASEIPEISEGNPQYSLVGATYEIYDNSSCSGEPAAVLTVEDESGYTNTVKLEPGRYWFKETRAGKGYGLKAFNPDTDWIEVARDNTVSRPAEIVTSDIPANDPAAIAIYKNAKEGKRRITEASATFKVEYFTSFDCTGVPERTWHFLTKNGRAAFYLEDYLDPAYESSELYRNSAGQITFPLGSLRISEEKAPEGYLKSDLVLTGAIQLKAEGQAEFKWNENSAFLHDPDGSPVFEDDEILAGVAFHKRDAETASGKAQGDGSLERAEIEIINRSGKAVYLADGTAIGDGETMFRLTTDSQGKAESAADALPAGTYEAVEVTASAGYLLNTGWKTTFTITEADAGRILDLGEKGVLPETPIRGGVELEKRDRENSMAQGDADFTGILFSITNMSEKAVLVEGKAYQPGEVVYTLATDESGAARSPEKLLPYGTYQIQEIASNGKYRLTSGAAHAFVISENGQTVKVNTQGGAIRFEDEVARGGVSFRKIDRELQENKAQGWGSLAGAEICIVNMSPNPVMVKEKVYGTGETVLTLVTDEKGFCGTEGDALPYGTYEARESVASAGYGISDWRVEFQIREDGQILELADQPLEEQVLRCDLLFRKADANGSPMAGIPFRVSLLDSEGQILESHVIVTDDQGMVSTREREKSPETVNTLDACVKDGRFTDETMLSSETNIWFGAADEASMEEGLGSLIYGQYLVEELQCEANRGQTILSSLVFELKEGEAGEELKEIFPAGETAEMSRLFIDLEIHPSSELVDGLTGSKTISPGTGRVEAVDRFYFDHLKTDQTYQLKTEIFYEDLQGARALLGENTLTFTPDSARGSVKNTVKLDVSALTEGRLHAVDTLYLMRGEELLELLTHNAGMNEESQILWMPTLGTEASDIATGDHQGASQTQAGISDIIRYQNLAPGMYKVIGILREASSGEPVKKPDGSECISELVLQISADVSEPRAKSFGVLAPVSGTVTMPAFTFDAAEYEGKDLVVTELLFDLNLLDEEKPWDQQDEALVLKHDSLTDQAQMVSYVRMGTSAVAGDSGTRIVEIGASEGNTSEAGASENSPAEAGTSESKTEAVILDTVTLTNLIRGASYRLQGTLMRKENQSVLMEGDKPVSVTGPVFTAQERNMTAQMVFTLDAAPLAGSSVVVFEKLFYITPEGEEVEICRHEDWENKEQTITFTKKEKPQPPESSQLLESSVPLEVSEVSEVSEVPVPSGNPPTGDKTPIALTAAVAAAAFLGLAAAVVWMIIKVKKEKEYEEVN